MQALHRWLLVSFLWAHAGLASALSEAPVQALSSYIELSGNCSGQVVEWNREYSDKVLAGETSRGFYFRVLNYQNWGSCAKPFFRPILAELQKVWNIYAGGMVTEAEYDAKEAELVNLFFAALADESKGMDMVSRYEGRTARRLMDLAQPLTYYNCTFFGDQPRCTK